MNLRRTLYLYIPLILAALLHNLVHESLHLFLAVLFGENIQEFHFLTNGLLTSQVIYATPVNARSGAHWLWIGLGPGVITVFIGLVVYILRKKILTRWPPVNLSIWYVGALFLTIDPLYLGALSWFMHGSDANAVEIIGWPVWPVRLFALAICGLTIRLILHWRGEARQEIGHFAQV